MGVTSRYGSRASRRATQLGNVGSRRGSRASRRALPVGDIIEYGSTTVGSSQPGTRRALRGVPDWYRQMQGTTLGDDTLGAMTPPAPLTQEQWQAEMLASSKELVAAQKHWADGDKMQKWIAIGATLAIPVSAAIWRALGVGRRRRP